MTAALLTKRDMAERLGCCTRTIENLIARGDGPVVIRTGRLIRVLETDFADWLDRCRQHPGSSADRGDA